MQQQYGRNGSMADATHHYGHQQHHHQNHRQNSGGSTGSSPDYPATGNGYDSGEYNDSPPPEGQHHSVSRTSSSGYVMQHQQQQQGYTPPSVDSPYATGSVSAVPFHRSHSGSYSSSTGGGYATQDVGYSTGYAVSAGAPAGGGWQASNPSYNAFGQRPRHSNSPPASAPLSPLDTRSTSYFPNSTAAPAHRNDFPLNPVASPSSPTTPSSVTDSPTTPFSPTSYSAPYGSHHHHSGSGSSYALPPLQAGAGHNAGHFVPPSGSEYPVPLSTTHYSPPPHPYGRSSPPDHQPNRSAPSAQSQTPVGPLAGPGFAARPFLCDDCGMNFARTHDLKRHQTTHVPGVKKTHPCPYCGKNLSRRDAIKRHVVSKQCPIANEKGYGWPPPEGHVPPPPDTVIERTRERRGENPYPILNSHPPTGSAPSERSGSSGPGGGYPSPTSPGAGPYSPGGYYGSMSSPTAYEQPHLHIQAPPPQQTVFEYDPRSYRGR